MGRIDPAVGAQHYQTFQVTSPLSTHTRVVRCGEDVDCDQYARGWRMKIDLGTDLGLKQAHYVKYESGRSFKVIAQHDGLVELEFAAGQPCFREHRVPLDRPEIYRVKGGDFRGNPLRTLTRVHKRPEYWVEEFQETTEKVKEAMERG